MKRTTSKYSITKFHFPSILFLFFGFLSCFLFQIPFSYLCFPDFKLCFCSTSTLFISKQTSWKHQFLVKRGVATKCFSINLCFAKCEKLSLFGPSFWQSLVDVKKHYKNRYFSTSRQKWPFLRLLSGPSKGLLSGPSWGSKKINLDQIITINIFAKKAVTPIFIVLFYKQCLNKANLDQIITIKKAKLGPDNNSTAYIYIYVYVYVYVCMLLR